MADGEIIIDTRINNKGAEADLKALQAKAKSTAQQIAALDKELNAATGKRSKLAADLDSARAAAEQTAAALEKVTSQLNAARGATLKQVRQEYPRFSDAAVQDIAASRFRGDNAARLAEQARLTAELEKQDATIAAAAKAYAAQDAAVQRLTARHEGLQARLQQEQAAVTRQSRLLRGANTAAAVLSRTLAGMRRLGQRAFGAVAAQVERVRAGLENARRSLRQFHTRLAGIVSGALVFNLISAGLRSLTAYMGQALLASSSLRTALGNLAGAAQTAAAPLIQVLTPALTAMANAAATLFSYLGRLVSFFTGTTVSASAQAAAGMAGVGSAAGETAKQVDKAARSLAGFDEINRLDAPQQDAGGGGAGAGSIVPNYEYAGHSPFLEALLGAIQAGEWFRVGRLVGEKLRDSLDAIPWPDIQDKARRWATGLARTVNGFVSTPGMWQSVGHTIAQGLNTATTFIDRFFQTVRWQTLGAGLANGLRRMVDGIDWAQLGRAMTDGLRAALNTLHGFVSTYTGADWAALGASIGRMIVSAVANIDWVQASGDLSRLAVGLLTAINHALAQVDWGEVGRTLLQMLAAIDWPGLISQLGQLLLNLLPVLLPALLLSGAKTVLSLVMAGMAQAATASIASFFTATVLPALGSGIAAVGSAIAGAWPVLLVAALALVAAAVLQFLIDHWAEISAWFQGVWQSFLAGWNQFWNQVAFCAQQWWINMQADWRNFWAAVSDLFTAAGSALQNTWNGIWTAMANAVTGIWNGITSTISGAIQGILSLIDGLFSAIGSMVESAQQAVSGLFGIQRSVAGYAGGQARVTARTYALPPVPALAAGAVIPPNREFLALLGDQRSGTNIEAPLDTLRQAFAETLAAYGGTAQGQPINIYLGDELLDTVIAQSQSRRNLRSGGR